MNIGDNILMGEKYDFLLRMNIKTITYNYQFNIFYCQSKLNEKENIRNDIKKGE